MDGALLGISSIDNSEQMCDFHKVRFHIIWQVIVLRLVFLLLMIQVKKTLYKLVSIWEFFLFVGWRNIWRNFNCLSTGHLLIRIHAQDLGAGIDDTYRKILTNGVPVALDVCLFGFGLIGLAGMTILKKVRNYK